MGQISTEIYTLTGARMAGAAAATATGGLATGAPIEGGAAMDLGGCGTAAMRTGISGSIIPRAADLDCVTGGKGAAASAMGSAAATGTARGTGKATGAGDTATCMFSACGNEGAFSMGGIAAGAVTGAASGTAGITASATGMTGIEAEASSSSRSSA